jgi:hypothetical protein
MDQADAATKPEEVKAEEVKPDVNVESKPEASPAQVQRNALTALCFALIVLAKCRAEWGEEKEEEEEEEGQGQGSWCRGYVQ